MLVWDILVEVQFQEKKMNGFFRGNVIKYHKNMKRMLLGFEYVNGQPYIMTLVTYAWEP